MSKMENNIKNKKAVEFLGDGLDMNASIFNTQICSIVSPKM